MEFIKQEPLSSESDEDVKNELEPELREEENEAPSRAEHSAIYSSETSHNSSNSAISHHTSSNSVTSHNSTYNKQLNENGCKSRSKVSRKDAIIASLEMERDELQNMVTAQNKLVEVQKERADNCCTTIKQLLIQKGSEEARTVRDRSRDNRLRLGYFEMQRLGANYAEQWVDGYAFVDIDRRRGKLVRDRDEVDRERKQLAKRKPVKVTANGVTNKSVDKICHSPTYYHQQDEVFKLKLAALKKEDSDLQADCDALERERNVHLRELKRIKAEDESNYRDNSCLGGRYLLLNLLGKGGFSEVFKCFDMESQSYRACKIHQLNKEWPEDKKSHYMRHAYREAEIHKLLDHPRIVRLYDIFEINNSAFCTILVFCGCNDLDFHLKQYKTLGEKESRSIISQTISGLKYLNEIQPPIIHYDLKPGNILLESSGEVKITDFGLSKIMDDKYNHDDGGMELTSQGAGTYWYLPPECFATGQEPPKISSKVDVWSVGVIFYQCLYGMKPYGNHLSQSAIVAEKTVLNAKEVEFLQKPVISSETKNFIRRCLTHAKENRPDVLTLAKDVYLKPSALKSRSAQT